MVPSLVKLMHAFYNTFPTGIQAETIRKSQQLCHSPIKKLHSVKYPIFLQRHGTDILAYILIF